MVKRNGTTYCNQSDNRITNGVYSDYVVAAVRTGDTNSGAAGISALLIPLKVQGVTRRKVKNSGVAASGSTFIEFDDVKVPVSYLLGKENQGFKIIMSSNILRYMTNLQTLTRRGWALRSKH